MKREQLKKLIKPIIKECIHEVIIESGVLSNVVAEVAKGMGNVIVESPEPQQAATLQVNNEPVNTKVHDSLVEHRKKLTEAIGKEAYGNIFDDVQPMTSAEQNPTAQGGAMAGVSSEDPGIDISGIIALGGKNWKTLAAGVKKR
tara:strand:- start:2787 stop:3218 length:432 start_codon:yes stop_codon:yes gene_type:complete